MPSSASSFAYIRQFILSRVAIVMEEEKEYLIESRLRSLMHKYGLEDLDALVVRLRQSAKDDLSTEVIDALTTNETYFFRDPALFEVMVNVVLPILMAARERKRCLKIWSAACSTGQEPYSLAMNIREQLPEITRWQVQLLATDVSKTCLDRAKAGRYRLLEVNRGLPAKYLKRYFDAEGADYQLKDNIREMVDFRYLNLIQDWPEELKPDLIMMRNVLIYFDVEMKKKILQRVRQVMAPDGYLMLGSAETTLNLDASFERVFPGTYRLKDAGLKDTGFGVQRRIGS